MFRPITQAYDLDEMRFVACKIHSLNSQWTEEKKANYTKVGPRKDSFSHSKHRQAPDPERLGSPSYKIKGTGRWEQLYVVNAACGGK